MSDSVRPHRQQPTRLPRPWDSPGKNTGVGRHFLLQCMKVKSEREVAQSCPTLSDPIDCSPPGSSVHGIFQARVLEWGAIAFSNCLVSTQLKVVRVSIQLKENLKDSLKYRTVCWLLLRKYTEPKFGRLYYFSFCFLVFLFFNGLSVTVYHWILTCLPTFHIGHQEKNNSKWSMCF